MTKIALDIDGVVASTERVVYEKVVTYFDLSRGDLRETGEYNNTYMHENPSLSEEINLYISQIFQEDPEVYLYAEEIAGSWQGSWILRPEAYITRRPSGYEILEATQQWLHSRNFFPAPVHHIPKGTCKSTKAKELGVDVLIEDSPYEIMSCRENGLRTLVMQYDYNTHIITPETEVMYNWDDILKWYENERVKEFSQRLAAFA